MTRETLIQLERVVKNYGDQSVIRIEHLSLHQGDRILLTGPNGSGKSTLARLIGRVSPADEGRIQRSPSFADEPLAYVPQRGGLYRDLTLQDNLHLWRELYGKPRVDVSGSECVRRLGLIPLLDRRFGELSGGFQRLAAIAAALHVGPGWLVLDEPFAGVEHRYREAVLECLRQQDSRLRLVVVASPTPEGFPTANRLLNLNGGRIACAAS